MIKRGACLIGERLGHSYSQKIHNMLGYEYALVSLKREELADFVKNGDYAYFNVTIPYKKAVMEYLDCISDEAKSIGAVNTVVKKGGVLYGYNTDIFGLGYMFSRDKVSVEGKKVVILGGGGAGVTAKYYAEQNGAREVVVISRTGADNYDNISKHYDDAEIIINATPVGMYPNNGACPIEILPFKAVEYVVDLVYNPLKTKLILDAEKRGVKSRSGLLMLVAQAARAKSIFYGGETDSEKIEEIYAKLYSEVRNIFLIGMPSSGKTTVGAALSKMLNMPFIDTDKYIEEKVGMTIPEIFSKFGERHFRELERETLILFSKESGKVISLGGGTVTICGAKELIKQNGVAVYLKRDQKMTDYSNRPLLKNEKAYLDLLNAREPLYNEIADITVENNADVSEAVKAIREKLL